MNIRNGKKSGEERRLCVGALETVVDVVLIEAQPDFSTEPLGLGKAGEVSGGWHAPPR